MKQGTIIALIIAAAILIAGGVIAWAILNQPPSALDTIAENVVSSMRGEALTDAMQRKKQTDTVIAMQKLGQSVEQYIMDNYSLGAPKVDNIRALIAALKSAGIDPSDVGLSPTDAWGNPYDYRSNVAPGAKYYVLTSYGADGAPGPEPLEPGLVTRFEEDLIWTNGHFSQLPSRR